MSDEYLRIPPYSEEAEISVLGAMMLDKEAINKVVQYLDHTSFYKEANQTIFRTMIELFNEGEPVDQISVINRLNRNKTIESAGGSYYITGLIEVTPSAANVEYYAKLVYEADTLRKLIAFSGEIENQAYDSNESVEEILENAHRKLYQIISRRTKGDFQLINKFTHPFMEEVDKIIRLKKLPGLETGFYKFDNLIGGFQSGLHIIASRPSMGKTSLALAISENIARSGKKVGIVSLETSGLRVIRRLTIRKARVDSQILNNGKIDSGELNKIEDAIGKLDKFPIYIDDSSDVKISSIIGKIRKLKQRIDIDIIFIDHLQLTDGGEGENRNQQIGDITRSLLNLSKELDIPIVLLSQLGRSAEGHMPTLSDCRDSGEIEQNADTVTFIFRPEKAGKKTINGKSMIGIAQIEVAKHRDGATGEFLLSFIEKLSTFENYTEEKIPF